MFDLHKLRRQDSGINLLILVISIFGLINVFSTTYYPKQTASNSFYQQIIFLVLGVVIYLGVTAFNSKYLQEWKVQFVLIILTVVSLLAVLVWGEVVYGTKRWINLGQFNFQPSELAKITIILVTALIFLHKQKVGFTAPYDWYINVRKRGFPSQFQKFVQNYGRLMVNLIVVLGICGLIWAEPALGNSVIAFGLWIILIISVFAKDWRIYLYPVVLVLALNLGFNFVNFNSLYQNINFDFHFQGIDILLVLVSLGLTILIMQLGRLKLSVVVSLFIVGVVGSQLANFAWNNVLTNYQKDRIVAYVDPSADPLGLHWQVRQAEIAVASGQIAGKGFLQGTQSSSGLLPFAYTDFAYAAFAEQFGLIGAFILLGSYYLLIVRMLRIGQQMPNNFGRLVAIGVAGMWTLNIMINVGMNLGIMPVTGVPLPLVSYGGSSVLVNMIGLGLVQMVYTETEVEIDAEKLGASELL